MRVLRLDIQDFRGIRRLTIKPNKGRNVLVGPCDCGKSTILAALALVLGPERIWEETFSRFDVHSLKRDQSRAAIKLGAALGDLTDDEWLLFADLREPLNEDMEAWAPGERCESPEEFDTRGSMLRVAVFYQWWMAEREERAAAFFPKEGAPEPGSAWRPVTARQREAIGVWSAPYNDPLWEAASLSTRSQLARAARSLEWDPGGERGIPHLVDTIVRAAEEAADQDKWEALQHLSTEITLGMRSILPESSSPSALRLTAALTDGWAQRMLELGVQANSGGDVRVPLRLHGTGTQRAFMVAARRAYADVRHGKDRGATEPIVTMDEPEVGLHPQAQRALVRQVSAGPGTEVQSFFATHSPTVVHEGEVDDVLVLKNDRGFVTATSLRPLPGRAPDLEEENARKNAERYWDRIAPGLFGRAALVAEGATEMCALPVFDAWAAGKDGVTGYRGFHGHDVTLLGAEGITNIQGLSRPLRHFGVCTIGLCDYDRHDGAKRIAEIRQAASFTVHLPDQEPWRTFDRMMAQDTNASAFTAVMKEWRRLYDGPFAKWASEGLTEVDPTAGRQVPSDDDEAAIQTLAQLYERESTVDAVRTWFVNGGHGSVFQKSARYARIWAQALVTHKSVPYAVHDLFRYLVEVAARGFPCSKDQDVHELRVRAHHDE